MAYDLKNHDAYLHDILTFDFDLKELHSNDDLDNYKLPGVWVCPFDIIIPTLKHLPPGLISSFKVYVDYALGYKRVSSDTEWPYIRQTIRGYNQRGIWERLTHNGRDWQNWYVYEPKELYYT